MLLRYLLGLGLIWGGLIWPQCQTNIDFNSWVQEGHAANGNWIVQGGGASVLQTINGDPTFYVSPDTFINVIIQGTIAISDNSSNPDDDFVGFVFGYQEPDANPNRYDFWLFDWKAQDQLYNNSNSFGREGFALTRLDGSIPQGNFNYLPAFWGRINSPNSTSIATNYGPGLGWNNGSSYDFTLIYTSTRVTILIDSIVIFDRPGCYEAGRFGFYNYSQPGVRYSNFSYQLISNFELEDNTLNQCIGEDVQFSFTDSTCAGSSSASDNISSWSWDFGDGSPGSAVANPIHSYPDTGNYDVTLRLIDLNGCQDSVTKTVTIHPSPIPTLGVPDSIFCPKDSVQLLAGGGATYQWSPLAGLNDPTIPNPKAYGQQPRNYLVEVISPFGCVADTSVYVHFFEIEMGADTNICLGDTIALAVQGGSEFTWTPSASLSNDAVSSPLAFPATTTSYQVIATDTANCTDTVSQLVVVNPLPVVSLRPDTAVCTGESVLFQAQGAFSYLWRDGAGGVLGTDDTLLLVPNATLGVIVVGTDSNGCQAADTTQLIVHPLPIVDAGLDQGLCSHLSLTLGSASNPAGTYAWTPAQGLSDPAIGQPLFTPISTDTFAFTLTLTDLNGCVNQDSVQVWVSPFAMSAYASDVPCFGEPGGSLTINAQGSAPFDYTWLDGASNILAQQVSSIDSATTDSLFAGSYDVVVVDSLGCTDTLAVVVSQPVAPLALLSTDVQNVDCFGNTTGEIGVTANGGTPGYQFSLNGGFTFQDSGRFVGLGASVYTTIGRDSQGCEATLTDTIRTPSGLFVQLTSLKHIDCFGNANGAFTLVATGGQLPYQASLDGVTYTTNLQFNNLPPGQDTISVIDANGCLARVPFQIIEPAPLTLGLLDQKNIACFGDSSGQVSLAASGGSGAYQYHLGSGSFQTDSSFANLPAGTYSLEVRDDSLCLAPLSVTMVEPPLLTLAITDQRNVACFGIENGAVSVAAAGGSPGYGYALDTMAFGPDTGFAGLAAGSYQVTVQDDSGCVTILPVEITQPDSLIAQIDQLFQVACHGDSTGEVRLHPVGGSQPYLFSVNGEASVPDSIFGRLTAGDYQFVVQDDSSCSDTLRVSLSQPDSLALTLLTQIDIDCFGDANGQVSVVGGGGVGPYRYRLDGQDWEGDAVFTNLTPGVHLIDMQDDSLCIKGIEVEIFEPGLLTSSTEGQGVGCYGDQTGQASILLDGGTQPYAVRWSSGDTSIAIDRLLPGTYQAVVQDANGCLLADSVTITQPDPLTIDLLAGSVVEAYCDWPNGSATVETSGGVMPHAVRWEGRNVVEGQVGTQLFGDTTYQVSVVDANGCMAVLALSLPHTPPPEVAFETMPPADREILLSQAQVQFVNRTEGATFYEWDFGDREVSLATSPTHTFLNPGTYQVRLRADNSYLACPRDTTVMLRIIPDGRLLLPNAFTPNQDGLNDDYKLGYEGVVSCHWEIFNRWGKLVARFDRVDATWDGRGLNGSPLPEGTYVIRIEAQLNNGSKIARGGSITLLR